MQFSPVVTSNMNAAQHRNQKIAVGEVRRPSSDFTGPPSFNCMYLRVTPSVFAIPFLSQLPSALLGPQQYPDFCCCSSPVYFPQSSKRDLLKILLGQILYPFPVALRMKFKLFTRTSKASWDLALTYLLSDPLHPSSPRHPSYSLCLAVLLQLSNGWPFLILPVLAQWPPAQVVPDHPTKVGPSFSCCLLRVDDL